MKKILVLVFLGIAVVPAQAQQAVSPLAHADTAFAIELYGKLDQTPGNLFFSPYSICSALDMVYVGAKGTTAAEMAQVLHLTLLDQPATATSLRQALLRAAAERQQQLTASQSNGFALQSANALWGDKSFTFNQQFISNIAASFGGNLRPVNFKKPERAAEKINDWVADQTQNRIQNLVSPDMLQGDPAMVLTNAVYFKSRWMRPFDEAATKPTTFHVSAAKDVTADMMNMQDKFGLLQADGIKLLTIPYGDYGTSMVIILPNDPQGLVEVETQLNAAKLDEWLAEAYDAPEVPVILSFPKFRMSDSFALKPVLQSLGMTTAFEPRKADFTDIADDPLRPLYVGDVVHKANISVDEKGTEAAAATAVTMVSVGGIEPPPPPPVRFNADHPFIYLVYAEQTGEILFMGRVNDPTQQGD